MTDKKLRKLMVTWAKRLRLQDWHLSVKQVSHIEGLDGDPYGATACKPAFMEAHIQIRAGLDTKETELTLVHELVHVMFGGLNPPEGTFEHIFEVGIEKVARVLVEIYGKNT